VTRTPSPSSSPAGHGLVVAQLRRRSVVLPCAAARARPTPAGPCRRAAHSPITSAGGRGAGNRACTSSLGSFLVLEPHRLPAPWLQAAAEHPGAAAARGDPARAVQQPAHSDSASGEPRPTARCALQRRHDVGPSWSLPHDQVSPWLAPSVCARRSRVQPERAQAAPGRCGRGLGAAVAAESRFVTTSYAASAGYCVTTDQPGQDPASRSWSPSSTTAESGGASRARGRASPGSPLTRASAGPGSREHDDRASGCSYRAARSGDRCATATNHVPRPGDRRTRVRIGHRQDRTVEASPMHRHAGTSSARRVTTLRLSSTCS
jgi:hypothetical protein